MCRPSKQVEVGAGRNALVAHLRPVACAASLAAALLALDVCVRRPGTRHERLASEKGKATRRERLPHGNDERGLYASE
jgi:hypothetical protein